MPKDVWNQYQLTPRGPFGGPFGYWGFKQEAFDDQDFSMKNLRTGKEYIPAADLNKAYRLAMNEYLERNQPKSYSEHDIIPSEYSYADMAQTTPYKPTELPLHIGPYKGGIASIKDMKNIGFDINAPNENQLMAGDFNLDFDEIGDTSLEQLQEYFKDIKPEDLGLPKEKEKPSVDWDIRNRVATGNTIVPDKGIMHAGILPPQLLAWMHPKNLAKIWAKQAQTNLALETGGKFVEKIKQERIKKKKEAEALAAAKAHAARQKSTPGYGSDPGGRDLTGGSRSSRGGAPTHSTRSLMAKGGRVGFSKGGIVDLWQELSNL